MMESAKRVAEKKDWIKGATGDWEIVLGLEVHAQVLAKSKLFSGASAEFGGEPNDHVSLVDAAMPGMLPVINEFCVEQAVRTGLGLKAQINKRSVFDRKNYFYPDLPQGYQISQYKQPVVGEGSVHVDVDGRAVEVGFFNLNNISRIDVSYSPTPDSPGSALAGSVNLVPRSSFERSKPVFNGSVYLMMRDDLLTLAKIPSLYRDPRRVIHPGADLSWIVPVSKSFGFSIATGASTQYSHQVGHTNTWRGVSAAMADSPATGASLPPGPL